MEEYSANKLCSLTFSYEQRLVRTAASRHSRKRTPYELYSHDLNLSPIDFQPSTVAEQKQGYALNASILSRYLYYCKLSGYNNRRDGRAVKAPR